MDHHSASMSAPPRRGGSVVLAGLAIVGVAIAAFAGEGTSVVPAPSGSAGVGRLTGAQAVSGEGDGILPAGVLPDGVVDEADGAIPDGAVVSVVDEQVPAVGRLDTNLLDALRRAAADAEADGVALRVNSGWRSPEYQWQLLQDAVVEYGSPEEAARWVATADTSAHVSGDAVDIGPVDAAEWLAEHGDDHGLCRVYGNEPWHFELRPGAVDDGCPSLYADPTEDPRMQA